MEGYKRGAKKQSTSAEPPYQATRDQAPQAASSHITLQFGFESEV